MNLDNVCMEYILRNEKQAKIHFQQLHTRKHVLTHNIWTVNNTALRSTYNSTEEKQFFREFGDWKTL